MSSETPNNDALHKRITEICERYALNAPKYARLIQARLDLGAERYGNVDLPLSDGRDMTAEAIEELLDAIVYLHVAELQETNEIQREIIEGAIENLVRTIEAIGT